jgi:hypothetical protein
MKILVVKEVLPFYKPISHIRRFEDLCKYLLFPFMHLYIPKESLNNENEPKNEESSISVRNELMS